MLVNQHLANRLYGESKLIASKLHVKILFQVLKQKLAMFTECAACLHACMKGHYTLNKFPKILAPRHEPRKYILWFSHFEHEAETKIRWNSLKFEAAIMIYFAKISCFIFLNIHETLALIETIVDSS